MTAHSSPILPEAEEFAGKILKNEVSPKLTYHNYEHTREVVRAVKEISNSMGISPEDEEVLLLAAWFHDLGYCKGNIHHEEESRKIALDFLEQKNYDPVRATKVGECIMATRMPQHPKDGLEKIMCDADLAHLGSDHFLRRTELLRQEIQEVKCQDLDKLTWLRITKKFIEQHEFFTPYARKMYTAGAELNLKKVEEEIQKLSAGPADEESLRSEIEDLKLQLEKAEAKGKKSREIKPSRSVDTMFKVMSKNHIDLSAMADTKANIMISINAIILSVVVSLLIRKLEEYPHFTIPALILTAVSLTSIVFAILATRPKILGGKFTREDIEKKRSNLLFFGNFHQSSLEDYEYGMKEMMKDTDFLYSSFVRDVYYLGKVLGKKYRLLRICYTVFLFGFVIAILSFIIAEGFFASPYPY